MPRPPPPPPPPPSPPPPPPSPPPSPVVVRDETSSATAATSGYSRHDRDPAAPPTVRDQEHRHRRGAMPAKVFDNVLARSIIGLAKLVDDDHQ